MVAQPRPPHRATQSLASANGTKDAPPRGPAPPPLLAGGATPAPSQQRAWVGSGRGVYLESSTDGARGKESWRGSRVGPARFPGLTGGRAGQRHLGARGLRCLSPPSRTPHGRRAARVPRCAVTRATLHGRGRPVPGGLAQAAGRVVVGPRGAGHLVLRCPRRAGTQAGLRRPRHRQQAEQRATLVTGTPHVQAAAGHR